MQGVLSESQLASFHGSLERCASLPDFFEFFYARFLESDAEIPRLLKNADIPRLVRMMKEALFLMMVASSGNASATARLGQLGRLHEEKLVRPEHYDLWLNALMSAVEERDPKYTQAVDESWRAVLAIGVAAMKGSASDE